MLRRVVDEAGQSEWLSTALKVGISLAAAGAAYAVITGPYAGLMNHVGNLLSGMGAKFSGLP